jgi:heat shock protein HtpX
LRRSRRRCSSCALPFAEFEADRSGAELLGTGEPLARALQKIDASAKQVPMNVDPALATAYIINPLSGRQMNFKKLWQTHPPNEERIARLRQQQHAH